MFGIVSFYLISEKEARTSNGTKTKEQNICCNAGLTKMPTGIPKKMLIVPDALLYK